VVSSESRNALTGIETPSFSAWNMPGYLSESRNALTGIETDYLAFPSMRRHNESESRNALTGIETIQRKFVYLHQAESESRNALTGIETVSGGLDDRLGIFV